MLSHKCEHPKWRTWHGFILFDFGIAKSRKLNSDKNGTHATNQPASQPWMRANEELEEQI